MQKFYYEYEPQIQDDLKIQVYTWSKDFRKAYFSQDFYFFCIYYFSESMFFETQDFHLFWYKLAASNFDILNTAFRGSWKTAIFGLFFIIYCICYELEEFILFLAFRWPDSVLKVTNIINVLKTNSRLINDFGFLYEDDNSRKRGKDKGIQPKTQSRFVTTNWILIQAVSLESWVRWLNFYEWGKVKRPTLVVADDIDILKSVKNVEVIDKNHEFVVNELFGWLEGRFIFLWNIIWEDWVVPRLIKSYSDSPAVRYTDQPLVNKAIIEDGKVLSWEIAMPDKFYWTDDEMFNAQYDREK